MSKFSFLILLVHLISVSFCQDPHIFAKGDKSPNVHHVGDVWLSELNAPDSIFNNGIAMATFAPGARLDWHKHPGGQILMITDGEGYYQERNKPKQIVSKGEIVKCLPDVEHWHGSTPTTGVTYIACSPSQKGKTFWMKRVTDDEYNLLPNNATIDDSPNVEQQITKLSKIKWQWMADKNVDSLGQLFHEKSQFVHMGGSWGKEREIEVIKNGNIHYKKADVHEVTVNIIDNTVILLNKITLLAVVGGNEVTNPFMVTEVYIKEKGKWTLGSLSFTKLLVP
jgi:4-carboxymuconolactone decarboxylase